VRKTAAGTADAATESSALFTRKMHGWVPPIPLPAACRPVVTAPARNQLGCGGEASIACHRASIEGNTLDSNPACSRAARSAAAHTSVLGNRSGPPNAI
jgi:hypothetical protein